MVKQTTAKSELHEVWFVTEYLDLSLCPTLVIHVHLRFSLWIVLVSFCFVFFFRQCHFSSECCTSMIRLSKDLRFCCCSLLWGRNQRIQTHHDSSWWLTLQNIDLTFIPYQYTWIQWQILFSCHNLSSALLNQIVRGGLHIFHWRLK